MALCSRAVNTILLVLALAVPASAFTRTASAPAGGSLLSNLRAKRTLLRGAAFDGLPDLSPLFSKLSQSPGTSSPLENFPQFPTLSLPAVPALELSALGDNALTSALSQLVSHVDPALQPLLLAPPALFALAVALDQWDQIGNGFESGGSLGSGSSSGSGVDAPFRSGSYNEEAASAFYGQRPLVVVKRLLSLASLTSTFNVKLLRDYLVTPKGPDGRKITPWVGENDRAKEALVLASALGPTFIKLGQAASIRTDLIPEPYALELRQLQDAVPPFGDEEAMAVLREQLGVDDLTTIFTSLSEQPVASASIGQVYRGTLRDGRSVAVKVQRPSVLGDICLDLFVLRLLTPIQTYASNYINKLKTDPADIATGLALVDEWGRGFVQEVDYRLEAKNTLEFKAAMEKRGLNAVTAPSVVSELSTSKVLVTEWVEGTRLDRDASADVPRLCGVAVNAYLTMLLDTGTLHCDPHPGNLLRTTDGKLCVLDWGMTLRVPPDLQYALLEFIAHINSEDFDALPSDFVNLGFTPPEKLEQVQNSGLTEGLAFALRQLGPGGGANKVRDRMKAEFASRYGEGLTDEEIRAAARAEMLSRAEEQLKSEGVDVNGVTNVMEEMSRRNRELFKLPPFVLYVSRAFSTLEGIGLSINEDYSILQECYPYLAKRLLTDNSPRARNALQAMLYGSTTPSNTGAATSTTHVLEPWTANSYADQASHNAYFNNRATSAASGASGGAAFAAAGVAAAAAAQSNTHGNNSNGNEADAAAAEAAAAGAARRRQRLGRSALGGGLVGAAGAAAMSGSGSIIDIASSSRRSSTGDSIVGAAGAGSNGNLQAKKVVEMGQGFASYTAATSDADAGKGVAEALNSALDLLLADDADPNFVQEVLVEETARLLDAAVVANLLDPLRSALTASAAAATAAAASATAAATAASTTSDSSSTSTGSSTSAGNGIQLPTSPANPSHALLAAATAPRGWVRALDEQIESFTPAPLRGLARLSTVGLRVPAELGATAATQLAALEPLFTKTNADAAALQTAADLLESVTGLVGGGGAATAPALEDGHNSGSGSGLSSTSGGGNGGTLSASALAERLASDPAATAQELATTAQETAARATAAWAELQESEAGRVVASKLQTKGPAAAQRFAKLLLAAGFARAADRLESATAHEQASLGGALNPEVVKAREAATRVLDPLALALER